MSKQKHKGIGDNVGGDKIITTVINNYSESSPDRHKPIKGTLRAKSAFVFQIKSKESFVLLISLAFVSLISAFTIYYALNNQYHPRDLVNEAWGLCDKGYYSAAINNTTQFINDHVNEADDVQQKLLEGKVPFPPVGAFTENQKIDIFNRPILNSVGICYYIKAISEERSLDYDKAINDYKEACKYTYARSYGCDGSVFFKNEWFWSPAEAASKQLKILENKIHSSK